MTGGGVKFEHTYIVGLHFKVVRGLYVATHYTAHLHACVAGLAANLAGFVTNLMGWCAEAWTAATCLLETLAGPAGPKAPWFLTVSKVLRRPTVGTQLEFAAAEMSSSAALSTSLPPIVHDHLPKRQ